MENKQYSKEELVEITIEALIKNHFYLKLNSKGIIYSSSEERGTDFVLVQLDDQSDLDLEAEELLEFLKIQ